MTVTFFGHRDAPADIQPVFEETLKELIRQDACCRFYVGNHGAFDGMVIRTLLKLKRSFIHIRYEVVLAYLPTSKDREWLQQHPTVLPEGIEKGPPRYAILKRNYWMIEQADVAVTYVKYNFGGAAQCREAAIKKGKRIIDLTNVFLSHYKIPIKKAGVIRKITPASALPIQFPAAAETTSLIL